MTETGAVSNLLLRTFEFVSDFDIRASNFREQPASILSDLKAHASRMTPAASSFAKIGFRFSAQTVRKIITGLFPRSIGGQCTGCFRSFMSYPYWRAMLRHRQGLIVRRLEGDAPSSPQVNRRATTERRPPRVIRLPAPTTIPAAVAADNLTNEQYAEVFGFPALGRAAYGGRESECVSAGERPRRFGKRRSLEVAHQRWPGVEACARIPTIGKRKKISKRAAQAAAPHAGVKRARGDPLRAQPGGDAGPTVGNERELSSLARLLHALREAQVDFQVAGMSPFEAAFRLSLLKGES
jgi:hypothetical protein